MTGRRLVTPGWGNPYRAEVGRRVRGAREAAGLSQRELASRAGITPGMLCYVERGQRSPSTATTAKLAAALGLTVEELRQRLAGDLSVASQRFARAGWYAEKVMTRADLHRLVDALPEESVEPTAVVLERARDPLWAVLQASPPDDEPVTAEDIAAVDESRAQPGISLEEFRAETA